jgi:hypothetical protein
VIFGKKMSFEDPIECGCFNPSPSKNVRFIVTFLPHTIFQAVQAKCEIQYVLLAENDNNLK